MHKITLKMMLLLILSLSLSGCVKMALTVAPSLIPNLAQSFFEECDPDLARKSMPSSLKLMEGLLKSDPDNKQILKTLCMAFTGYALLFIEYENPDAASRYYLRARNYGFKALDLEEFVLTNDRVHVKDLEKQVQTFNKKNIEMLFWTTMAWNAWISLNLDKPSALGQLRPAQAFLDKVMEIDPHFFHGSPYILKGTMLALMPGPLGGDIEKSKACFDQALVLGNNRFFLVDYYFARYYAVRTQDKKLFLDLIEKVQHSSENNFQDTCLINSVMRKKTTQLKNRIEDFFL